MIESRGDGGVPKCVNTDFTGEFFMPRSADTYHPGDTIAVAWYGGKSPVADSQSAHQRISLVVESIEPPTTTEIFTDKPYWFRFEPHPQWAPIDVCDNTQMSYDWTVPNVFATSSVTKYTMYAKNASESPPSVIAKSDVFSIQLKPSNSSSSSATPMSTSTSSTPPPTSTDATAPEPWSPGLSTGGKVGIGVGVPAGAALLALTAWFFWGRRRTRPSAERFEKAELDAKTEARIEAGGAEIMEMGGDTHHWAGAASQREPAELCGGLVSHPSGGDTHVVVSGTEGEERGGSESM